MYPFIKLGDIFIPTYYLLISLAYCLGILWLVRRSALRDFNRNQVLDVCFAAMLGSFIGARLLHVLYEDPRYYWQHPQLILAFWQGGFVYFGGFIGAFTAALFVLRRERQNWLKWFDLFAPVVSAGYVIGRVACFFAGCCYGRVCEWPWAVKFPAGVEAPANVPLHPTQLYAAFFEMGVLVLLLRGEGSDKFKKPGQLFSIWLIGHSLGRVIMEYFRADYRGPAMGIMSISLILSVILFSFAVILRRILATKRG